MAKKAKKVTLKPSDTVTVAAEPPVKTVAGNAHRTIIVKGDQAAAELRIHDPGSTLFSNAE